MSLEELSDLPPPSAPPLPPALEAELAQLAPVATRRPLRQLAVLLAVSLVYAAGVLALIAMRRDLGELPVAWFAGAGTAWLVGFVAPLYLATVPRPGAIMPRSRLAGIAAITGSLAFVALGLAIHPGGAAGVPFWRGGGCFGTGLAAAIVPVVLGSLVLRGTLPVGARWVAAALGAGAGSLGGLVLHLHCPITDGVHIGLVHGGVVGGAALLAAALVPRAIELR